MKGDFSRLTFDPTKNYGSVRMQQGRVQLDADWNEQVDINEHRIGTLFTDLIGLSGVPQGASTIVPSDFQVHVTNTGSELHLNEGHMYVAGKLVQNDTTVSLTAQPNLPAATLPSTDGRYLAYLDVWQRLVTTLEDPQIRDAALGGADTTVRTQNVWQVKLVPLDDQDDVIGNIDGLLDQRTPAPISTGRMSARLRQANTMLDNRLYRVEVHDAGALGGATFKWSQDNGAIAASITQIHTTTINDAQVSTIILSDTETAVQSRFAANQWIEFSNEALTLNGLPGIFAKLTAVSERSLTVESWAPLTAEQQAICGQDWQQNLGAQPIVRRWDSSGVVTLEMPTTNDGWLELEQGIEVSFAAGNYKTGDYWLIPARHLTGQIDWPAADPQPPLGIQHYYAPLAALTLANKTWMIQEDVRRLFSALTGGLLSKQGDTMPGSLRIGSNLYVDDKVGIGTTDPHVQLDVSGNAIIREGLMVDTNTLYVDSVKKRVGIGTTTPGEQLDVQGAVRATNGFYMDVKTVELDAAGWCRFAQGPQNGNNNAGVFEIRWRTSGRHGHVRFAVGANFGDDGGSHITVLEQSSYKDKVVEKIRLLMGGTYDQHFVEFYFEADRSVPFDIYQLSGYGWSLIEPIPGSQPQNYAAHELPSNILFATRSGADNSSLFVIDNNAKVGIGKAAPTAKLDVSGNALISGSLTVDTNTLHVDNINNRVGIGTTTPQSDLEIGNFDQRDRYVTLKVAGGNNYRSGVRLWAWRENFGYSLEFDDRRTAGYGLHIKQHDEDADGSTLMFFDEDGNVGIGTTFDEDGNVGIGTTTLGAKLEVNGSLKATSNMSGERELYTESPTAGNHRGDSTTQNATGLVYRVKSNPASGDPIFQVRSLGEAVRFFVEHDGWTGSKDNSAWFGGSKDNYFDGNVGIGTTEPKAKLHVNGSGNTIQSFTGDHNGGAWMHNNSGSGEDEIDWAKDAAPLRDLSIYASGSVVVDGKGVIVASTVNWSDERSKNVISRSNSKEDLALLSQIKITDYTKIREGNREKKVIAQELRDVLPQAVSTMRGVVPTIFERSDTFTFDEAQKELTISLSKAHLLEQGHLIDVYTDKTKLAETKVIAVPDEHTVVIACDDKPEDVLVYGKWVDDVHMVDYDAISMLNVSATQYLYHLVQNQQTALEQQSRQIAQLQERMADKVPGLPA